VGRASFCLSFQLSLMGQYALVHAELRLKIRLGVSGSTASGWMEAGGALGAALGAALRAALGTAPYYNRHMRRSASKGRVQVP
jgi:hypothetical protein